MRRFARPINQAGLIEPRAGLEPEPPRERPTFARLVGAVGMIALAATLYWLLTDASFRVTAGDVTFEGLRHADERAMRAHLGGLERSPNVLRVRATEIVRDLSSLPEVAGADAIVTLPASISVRVEEREPIFAWSDGQMDWLVDREGRLFAPAPASATMAAPGPAPGPGSPGDAAGASPGDGAASSTTPAAAGDGGTAGGDQAAAGIPPAAAGLPRIVDWRGTVRSVTAGDRLPAIDLQVMRQLLSLTPERLGSHNVDLSLRVYKDLGYVLTSESWQAIFGHYTPTLQPPDVVPRQVQCLRWLLANGEKRLQTIRLAVSANGCGTRTVFERGDATPKP